MIRWVGRGATANVKKERRTEIIKWKFELRLRIQNDRIQFYRY